MLESLKKNKKGICLILITATGLSLAQYMWKMMGGMEMPQMLIYLIAGFAIAGIGGISMIFAYKYGELSVIHPMNSFSYVISAVISVVVLHEQMTVSKALGIFIIITGVILIGGSGE